MVSRLAIVFFTLFCFKLAAYSVSDSTSIILLVPTPKDTVDSGKLLLIIQLPSTIDSKLSDFKIIIDGKRDISESMMLRKNLLSVIYSESLSPGMHTFELLTKQNKTGDFIILFNSYFYVNSTDLASDTHSTNQNLTKKEEVPKTKKPFIRGNIFFSSSNTNLSGLGAALRQEPNTVHDIRGNITMRAGKGEISMKGLYTTNAQGSFAFRNTFTLGYSKNESSIEIGDQFVNQDRFTFSGIRVRGVYLDAFIPNSDKKVKFRFMYGKNVDANYVPNTFPHHSDSSVNIFQGLIPKYERDYYLVQFHVQHSKHSYGHFGLVRVRDYANGNFIEGISPQDNVSIHWEKYIPLVQNRGYVRINSAMAYTSFNNTLGGNKAFNFLIHLNASTVPFTYKNAPQFAFGLATSIPITKNNDLIIDGRRIGSSYYSFANPYMLNNRQYIRISDRLRLFKNNFFLSIAYDYMIDNLGKQRPQTRENSSISGSSTIKFSKKLPRLTLGYRHFLGNTFSNLQENYNVNNVSIFGSLNYSLNKNSITYQLIVSRNDMNLISDVMVNNHQESNSISISAIYKNKIGASMQGAQTNYYYQGIKQPQTYFAGQVWYRILKPDIRIKISSFSNSFQNQELKKETRKSIQASLDFGIKRYFNISVIAGIQPFQSFDNKYSYEERFVRLRGAIRF